MGSIRSYLGKGNNMSELQELLTQLHQCGLHGHISEGPPSQIVGGRSVSKLMAIPIYRDSFSVSRDSRGWLVRVDGEGQRVNEAIVTTADEVVRAIAGGA